ncbi:MAG: tetratricopeptide repeat protein, partial [Anaerolineae bacterium]|nr:tetratricopeptide repeat protein [Anaerolineae bacterium]
RSDWEGHLWFGTTLCEEPELANERAILLNNLGDILFQQGDMAGAAGIHATISGMGLQGPARLIEISATIRAIDGLLYQNQPQKARLLFEEFTHALPQMNLPEDAAIMARAHSHFIEGVLLRYDGRLHEALHCMTGGIELLQPVTQLPPGILAELYRLRGLTAWSLGQYLQAKQDLRQATAIYRQQHDLFSVSLASGNLGLVYWSQSQLNRAERITRYSLRVARQVGADLQEIAQTGNLGLVYLSKGWCRRAKKLFDRQISKARENIVTSEQQRGQDNRALALFHLGQPQQALHHLEARLDGTDNPVSQGDIYLTLSRCYNSLGDRPRALLAAEQGLHISHQTHSVPLQIVALRVLAECRPGQAVSLLEDALALARERRRGLDVAACLLMLGHHRRDASLWERGRRILQNYEADAWLQGKSLLEPPHVIAIS